ncbi:MAG: hypothetical protein HYY20_14230 [Candidatus Tectomicrobia bacterium]|uniref:Cytochrome c-552/DMSO reductase-like haem-binding domain-containing protein n=1 Tax=Tectimicrobiota bacterium TaxID=2528274 RepID=A0A932CR61_UNCTE|nr:hypothetical protein [Candidatus Tectomicrobia bacterium]
MNGIRWRWLFKLWGIIAIGGLVATGTVVGKEGKGMKSHRVDLDTQELLDPHAAAWDRVEGQVISLDPTPVENLKEISPYMVATSDMKTFGKVREIQVKTVHNGKEIFFRLAWRDPTQDVELSAPDDFVDACGILFSLGGKATTKSLAHMGAPDNPVNAWYWRADLKDPLNLTARGLGTTQKTASNHHLFSRARWEDGSWKVVLGRSLKTPDRSREAVRLQPGKGTKVAFAVMDGSNRERGGLKSFSVDWDVLVIEK